MRPRSIDVRQRALLLTAALVLGVRTIGCAAGTDKPDEAEPPFGDGGGESLAEAGAIEASAPGDGSLDGGNTPPNERCSEDGWCRVDMPDDKAALYGIWGSGPSDVWTVGSNGAVFHWDGTKWSAHRVETDAGQARPMFAVWGSGPSDVWAVTGTDILHSNGWTDDGPNFSAFEVIKRMGQADPLSVALRALGGSGPTDVYVLRALTGAPGALPFDKCSRSEGWSSGTPNLTAAIGERGGAIGTDVTAIWATNARDIWMVGESGRIFHSDGYWGGMVDFTQANSNTLADLHAVWGARADAVWAVGDRGTIRHFTYDPGGALHWAIEDSKTTSALRAVWGSSATDVWVVGDDGTILHGDGSSWSPSRVPVLPPETPLYGVWGSGPDDVWVVGQRVLLHRSGPTGGAK